MASKLAKPNDKVDLLCVKTWFHCRNEKCSRWFYSIPALKEHFKMEHPGEVLTLPDNLSPEVMEGHVELEEKPELRTWKVNCRAGCFRSFRSQSELNFHMKKRSKCYLPYAHDQDSSKTGNHSNAASDGDPPQPIETKSTNTPRKPVKSRGKCPSQHTLQGKAAPSSLAKPRRANSRRFHCDTCDKSFLNRHNLTRHIATHPGNCRFQCNVCKGRFSRKDVLTVHMRRFHNKKNVTNHTAIAAKIIKGVKLAAVGGKTQKKVILKNKKQTVKRENSRKKESTSGNEKRGRGRPKSEETKLPYSCHLCPFKGIEGTWAENHRRLHEQGAAAVICPVCEWHVSPTALAVHHARRHGTARDSSTARGE